MKKLLSVIIIAFIACTCAAVFAPQDVAYAAVDNYFVVSPNLDNYLYLDSPEKVAIYGDNVAVYDSGLNKVFVAGGSPAVYDASIVGNDDIVSIAFASGDVYALTDSVLLYNITAGVKVDMDIDVWRMSGDGTNLYFYNRFFKVYRYDGSTFTPYTDTSRLIADATEFTVSENVAYLYKEGKIYKMPLTATTSATVFAETQATRLLPAEDAVIALSGSSITVLPTTSDDVRTWPLADAFPKVKDIKDIATDLENVAVLSDGDKAVFKYSSDTFTFDCIYGCASSAQGWYNNPVSITAIGDSVVVWDKGNSRLGKYIPSSGLHEYLDYVDIPLTDCVCDDYYAFYTDGSAVYMSALDTDERVTLTGVETGYDIGAMCVSDNRLYLYDKVTGTVYYGEYHNSDIGFKASDFVFKPLFVSYNRILDMKAKGGDFPVIYANTGSKIEVFSRIGKSNISIELGNEISCFEVDAVGNVYTVSNIETGAHVTKYTRTSDGFSAGTPLALTGSFPIEGVNSIAFTEGTASDAVDCVYAIDNRKNLLLKINIEYTRAAEYTAPAPVDSDGYSANVSFVKSKGTVLYAYPDNYNVLSGVAAVGDVLAVLDGHSTDYTLYVMTSEGKFGYVAKADTITATPLTADGTVISLHDSVNVYKLPSSNSPRTSFDKSQVFTLIDDCADFGNGTAWYKVSYQNGDSTVYGYLLKTRVMSYTVVPEKEEPVYGKAKSQRIGATVNLYAMADVDAAVVAAVADGTKLMLLEDYDKNSQFTLVEYNGQKCYVLTAELTLTQGLTGGQIAAIVLASVTLTITCVYLIISKRNKKVA